MHFFRLAAVPAVAGTLGILFCQILGAAVNWKVLSIVLASLNIPFLAFLLFIPESPVFLITTNQIDRAHKVLRVLRGPKWNITAELTDIKVAQDVHKQQVSFSNNRMGTVRIVKGCSEGPKAGAD